MLRNTRTHGFTIVEILVALLILGMFLAVSATVFKSLKYSYELRTATQDIILALASAREATLRSLNDTVYSVRIESDRIVRFTGTTYVATSSSNVVFALPVSLTTTPSLTGGTSTLSFTRLTGIPSATGTITVQSITGDNATVTIGASGIARKE